MSTRLFVSTSPFGEVDRRPLDLLGRVFGDAYDLHWIGLDRLYRETAVRPRYR